MLFRLRTLKIQKNGIAMYDWVDFNFYGHQVVAHLSSNFNVNQTNEVDGEQVPIRHFGVILTTNDWDRLRDKLESKEIEFIIQPNVRFENSQGEQKTMFISDPSGNALEFKCFQKKRNTFVPFISVFAFTRFRIG